MKYISMDEKGTKDDLLVAVLLIAMFISSIGVGPLLAESLLFVQLNISAKFLDAAIR